MEVCASTVSINVCTTTTTTTHKYFHHHVSNGFMRVALRLKCQLYSCCNLTARKMTNTQKPRLGLIIQKFNRYYTSPRREKQKMNWVDGGNLTKRNKMSWGEREVGQTPTSNYSFSVLCCSFPTCLFASFVFTASR